MLKSLHLKNWPKHQDRIFNFGEGFNLLWGMNEAGKSLVFEALSFALWGSQALRVPVKDMPKGFSITAEFYVSGTLQTIHRTADSAELVGIATGTTPVNAAVIQLLGFNRQMFEITTLAKQGEIGQLLAMDGTSRRRLLNTAVGLTPLESLEKKYLSDLKLLKAELSNLERMLASEPEKPTNSLGILFASQLPIMREDLEADQNKLLRHHLVVKQEQALNQAKPSVKLEAVVEPDQPAVSWRILHETRDELKRIAAVKQSIQAVQKNYDQRAGQMSAYVSLEALKTAWIDHQNWKAVEPLKRLGTVPCEHCGQRTHVAAERMQQYGKVAECSQPLLTVQQAKLLTEMEQHLADLKASIADSSVDKLESRLSQHQLLIQQSEKQQKAYTAYQANAAAWVQYEGMRKALNLEDLLTAEGVATVEAEIEELKTRISEVERSVRITEAYAQYKQQLAKQTAFLQQKEKEISDKQMALELVKESTHQIKGLLLPKIVVVASKLVQIMSEDLHTRIEFSPKMDLLVDGKSIQALSGSGQTLVHLSIRLALAKVMSNDSLPMFIGDEIDASMTATRAHLVVEALRDLLNGRIKQVLMISHKPVEGVDHLIEV